MSEFMKSLCKIAIPVTLQSMLQASFSIVDQSKLWSSCCKHSAELSADIWKIRIFMYGNKGRCHCHTYFAVV